MGKSDKGICQICGNFDLLTDDHLPQKCLYPKSIRSSIKNMNIVKACFNCNNGSKISDEQMKVIFGNVAHSYWEGEMWNSTVSTLDNNKKLEELIEKYTKYEYVENDNSIAAPLKVLSIKNELKNSFLTSFDRIVKGLFYKHYKEVLVINRELSIFHIDGLHPNKTEEIQKNLDKSTWKEINDGTCRYVFIEMDSTDIVIIIELFNSVKLHYVIQAKNNLTNSLSGRKKHAA